MPHSFANPTTPLQSWLRRRHLDAMLISQPENRRYLSGFSAHDHSISESSGFLLILPGRRPFLLTDFRFQLDAETEAPGYEVLVYKQGVVALLSTLLPSLGVRRLAFESHYVLHAFFLSLAKTAGRHGIELAPLKGVVEKARRTKNLEEIEKIQRSVRLNEEVFQEVFQTLHAGETERQVALRIEALMRAKGAQGPSFETIVASGPNGASPHAVPSDRPLQEGEPIVIDMGLRLAGYCSDMTRTVVLGTPDPETIALFRLVRKAQLAGLAALKAGVKARDVDRAARTIIAEAGYGNRFGHGLGHGVGLAVHEEPSLSRRSRRILQANMVVTVEPGIYLPGWGGIRLENMALVTENGYRLLNKDTTFLDL